MDIKSPKDSVSCVVQLSLVKCQILCIFISQSLTFPIKPLHMFDGSSVYQIKCDFGTVKGHSPSSIRPNS